MFGWWQIEDLQLSVSRMEKEHGRREDIFRQEISDMQQVWMTSYNFSVVKMC